MAVKSKFDKSNPDLMMEFCFKLMLAGTAVFCLAAGVVAWVL